MTFWRIAYLIIYWGTTILRTCQCTASRCSCVLTRACARLVSPPYWLGSLRYAALPDTPGTRQCHADCDHEQGACRAHRRCRPPHSHEPRQRPSQHAAQGPDHRTHVKDGHSPTTEGSRGVRLDDGLH